jgi:hypothetical protein
MVGSVRLAEVERGRMQCVRLRRRFDRRGTEGCVVRCQPIDLASAVIVLPDQRTNVAIGTALRRGSEMKTFIGTTRAVRFAVIAGVVSREVASSDTVSSIRKSGLPSVVLDASI